MYTKWEVEEAKRARDLYRMLAYPYFKDMSEAISSGTLIDCPVTIQSLKSLTDIYGAPDDILKGKTTHTTTQPDKIITIIRPAGNDVHLNGDIFLWKDSLPNFRDSSQPSGHHSISQQNRRYDQQSFRSTYHQLQSTRIPSNRSFPRQWQWTNRPQWNLPTTGCQTDLCTTRPTELVASKVEMIIHSKNETIRALVLSNEQTVKSNEQTIKYTDTIIRKLNIDLVNANTHVRSLMGWPTLKYIVDEIEVMLEGLTEKMQKGKGESSWTFKWRNILKCDVSGLLTSLNKDEKDLKHDWIIDLKASDQIHGYSADYIIIPNNLLIDREVQLAVAICQASKLKYKMDI